MTELTNILGKSYDTANLLIFKPLKKILGKVYEKLKKILRKTYDELTKKLRNAKKGLEN